MFKILEHEILSWNKADGHVRCMAHILNISAQKILQVSKAESLTAEVVLAEEEFGGLKEKSPAGVLQMSCKTISKIRASNLQLEALSAQAIAAKLEDLKPLLDM